MSEINVDIEHLTRVEGHGNIVINAKDGKIQKVRWNVTEAPRYFEILVKDRPYRQIAQITSRICGICSIAHTTASLKATEQAMNINVSEQDRILRKLALHGENIQSHVLHLGYLVLPDLLGTGSVIPLKSSHPEELKTVIRIHRLANDMSRLICGRATHPRRLILGGFTKTPSPLELEDLKIRLDESIKDLKSLSCLVRDSILEMPEFERETEFISLTNDREYPFYDGDIFSSDTGRSPIEDYLSITNEYIVPHSTAKYTKNNRESYMVGALARINNNYDKLSTLSKEVAQDFNFEPECHNPFMNNISQLIEIFHNVSNSIDLIDKLLDRGLKERGIGHELEIDVKFGRGIGIVEAPRGILFHDYTYDDNGYCDKANLIIPTNQNHGNIQQDMEAFTPTMINEKDEDEIELTLEMLVRAYDPCISCSTHCIDVEFV